jgi:pimeloyl-ACP methyl ester carboxylesterase/membrane protein DedA with SNARE-associated domain
MNQVRKIKLNPPKKWEVKRWHTIAAVYIMLLVISYFVRLSYPVQIQVATDQKIVTLGQSNSIETFHRNIKMAYIDTDPDATGKDPVILLLHGSPVAARKTFHNLIPALTQTGRVIAPDLPGFGSSTQKIPDYSIEAHAKYVLRFLHHIGIDKVHVVAYSMGGGVALNLAHMSPEHVRSITLLSAIGIQEFELLGNYHLNHALHGIQLASIWLLKNGLPHMGVLDRVPIGLAYARNFYDTDQRPLRTYLAEFDAPLLILHGQRDALIPVAAAQEHFRIVPQSELKLYDDGHLMVFNQTNQLADDIRDFIQRVETAGTKFRTTADPQRIADAHKAVNEVKFPAVTGITLIIFMFLIALATLISEDLTCIGAGLMAAKGTIGFIPAVAGSFLGIFLGDILLFLAGKHLGRPALGYPPLKWIINDEDISRTSRWFNAKGPIIITASRFLPGSRLPTYFGAGMLGTSFWLFSFYFFMAALIWTPLLVGLAAVVGSQMLVYYDQYKHYGIMILVGTIFFLWLLIKLVVPLFSLQGRQWLLSSFQHKIQKVINLFFK